MEYPGNPSLSEEIKARIVSTFEQTLESARSGKRQEAQLGCDFILKLDAQFEPAQKLAKLLESMEEQPVGQSAPPPAAAAPPRAAPPPAKAGGEDPRHVAILEALLKKRRFQDVLKYATQNEAALSADPRLPGLLEAATARLEAEPYVASFLQSAREALGQGDRETVANLLEKAKALDPSHPGIESLGRLVGPQADPSATVRVPMEFSAGLDDTVMGAGSPPPAAMAPTPTPPVAEAPKPFSLGNEGPESPVPPSPPPVPPAAAPPSMAFADNPASPPQEAENPFADLETEFAASGDDPFENISFDSSSDTGEISAQELEGGAASSLEDQPFSAPSSGPAPTGDGRINELLADGQAAFDAGDHQGAIDAWSRIFLIDVDNNEASHLIEKARKLKAESERQVEEIYHDGLNAWEKGDGAKATEAFNRVLSIQPSHAAAQDLLKQIAEGGSPQPVPAAPLSVAPPTVAGEDAGQDLLNEIMVPPDTELAFSEEDILEGKHEPAAKGGGGKKFLGIGLVVLLLVGAGGWYLFTNRDSFFPNADEKVDLAASKEDPIAKARKLHEQGNQKKALEQLKGVKKGSPHFAAAQALIAKWSAASRPADQRTLDPELAQRRDLLVAEARKSADQGEFLRVREVLRRANKLAPLAGDELEISDRAEQALRPFRSQLQLIEDREWEFALKDLWQFYLADRENRDIKRMIVDSYFNLGVRDLQRGNKPGAAENFSEALALRPDDAEAQRHALFAQAYENKPPDLLYRIYVKYLPYR